jgi:2-isopropylmalate synthase
MNMEQKLTFFKFLTEIGFKEIEIGFPAASDTEFQFTRTLIEKGLIPPGVTIQVLTQAREHIIRRTFEALAGAPRAIVHLYNATSPLWRDVVFNKSKAEVIELAVTGAGLFNEMAKSADSEFLFEYSPESFSLTEMDFAAEVCNAVLNEWKDRTGTIINLPLTVEMATPNVHADQIEYMCRHLRNRNDITVSLHTHNDRGTAVAATELALMAGADRVEGTLFGNGERTGNVDIVTMAMNLYSQGIDPKLDFARMDRAIDIYEKSTGLAVHPRHPYAGDLVYTAFSGSHQDAIRKGMKRLGEKGGHWSVPYLLIDPRDVGRSFDPVIRFNSQSGRSGAAYLLETHFGLDMPKRMKQHFGPIVINASDQAGRELPPEEIYALFKATYINLGEPLSLVNYEVAGASTGTHPAPKQNQADINAAAVTASLLYNNAEIDIAGEGNGFVDAFCDALSGYLKLPFEIMKYNQHSMEYGTRSRAITYIEIAAGEKTCYGAGVSSNTSTSSLRAVVSAVNNVFCVKQ